MATGAGAPNAASTCAAASPAQLAVTPLQRSLPPSTSRSTRSAAAPTSDEDGRKKKPYKELTLEGKIELIRLAQTNPGLSQAAIAERYGIAKSNVCRVLQRRAEYLHAFESQRFAGSRKRKLRDSSGVPLRKLTAQIV